MRICIVYAHQYHVNKDIPVGTYSKTFQAATQKVFKTKNHLMQIQSKQYFWTRIKLQPDIKTYVLSYFWVLA